MYQGIRIAGFGGQGVISAGILLAQAGVENKKNASWLPSYGPEMRGGTANCSVVVSDGEVYTPIVSAPYSKAAEMRLASPYPVEQPRTRTFFGAYPPSAAVFVPRFAF